jgi:GTPase
MLSHCRVALTRPHSLNILKQYRNSITRGRLSSNLTGTDDIPKLEIIKVPYTLSTATSSTVPKLKTLSIALVGRPNTGKSTLFNRLTSTNLAIVSDVPGTTRDRKQEKGSLASLPLLVMDTGGLDDRGAINVQIQEQVHQALTHADVVIFMLDAKVGVTALDEHFAKWIRKTLGQIEKVESEKRNKVGGRKEASATSALPKELIVIANKTEGAHLSDRVLDCIADALRLGLGEPIPLSAAHG